MARIKNTTTQYAPKNVEVVKSVFDVYTLQDLRKMVSNYKTKHDVVNYSKLSKPKLIDLLEQKFTIHNGSLYYKLGEIKPQQVEQNNFLEEDDDFMNFDPNNSFFDEQAPAPVQYVALKRPMPARKVFVDENTEVVRVPAQTENRKRIVMTENSKKCPFQKNKPKNQVRKIIVRI